MTLKQSYISISSCICAGFQATCSRLCSMLLASRRRTGRFYWEFMGTLTMTQWSGKFFEAWPPLRTCGKLSCRSLLLVHFKSIVILKLLSPSYGKKRCWCLVQDPSCRSGGGHLPHSGVAPDHPHCVSRLRRLPVCLGLHPGQLGQPHWEVGGFCQCLSHLRHCDERLRCCVFMAAGSRSAPSPSRPSSTLLPHTSPLSRTWNKYVCHHFMGYLFFKMLLYLLNFTYSHMISLII